LLPESYYSENIREIKWNEWNGTDARSINEFKDMVKAFHKEGIAVIMDVVYNHLSEYELEILKRSIKNIISDLMKMAILLLKVIAVMI
jgi:pullulanase/glycogen debranching enzyme